MTSAEPRPNPDQLIAPVQADEKVAARGKLKIFLGYAAGVGKTYAMLEAAHQRRTQGVDLVIGYVETHQRAETEAKLASLEIIPRKTIEYNGVNLPEMDVDALLARRPKLAIVDELAHTNVPGSRHPKRYQDVNELLDGCLRRDTRASGDASGKTRTGGPHPASGRGVGRAHPDHSGKWQEGGWVVLISFSILIIIANLHC